MGSSFCFRSLALGLCLTWWWSAPLFAAEPEIREFRVIVDGQPQGTHRLRIADGERGETVVRVDAEVRIDFLVYAYVYAIQAEEAWKDGRLSRTSARIEDGSTRTRISGTIDSKGSKLNFNGKARTGRAAALSSIFWSLPAENIRKQPFVLLDVDTGELREARLEQRERGSVKAGDSNVDCTHYRISGGAQADLWFDAAGRLVRQESIEDGHRTVLSLSAIRREAPRTAQNTAGSTASGAASPARKSQDTAGSGRSR
jgi:hypothetical protein